MLSSININGTNHPAQNSEGQSLAQTAAGLRDFWLWFAGSKVTDEQGRPIKMVHGSLAGDIVEFKGNGTWFAPIHDTCDADIIMSEGAEYLPNADPENLPYVAVGATAYPAYLCIKNPVPENLATDFYNSKESAVSLMAKGYDGAVWDDGVAVAFSDAQIRSAISNTNQSYADDDEQSPAPGN